MMTICNRAGHARASIGPRLLYKAIYLALIQVQNRTWHHSYHCQHFDFFLCIGFMVQKKFF